MAISARARKQSHRRIQSEVQYQNVLNAGPTAVVRGSGDRYNETVDRRVAAVGPRVQILDALCNVYSVLESPGRRGEGDIDLKIDTH